MRAPETQLTVLCVKLQTLRKDCRCSLQNQLVYYCCWGNARRRETATCSWSHRVSRTEPGDNLPPITPVAFPTSVTSLHHLQMFIKDLLLSRLYARHWGCVWGKQTGPSRRPLIVRRKILNKLLQIYWQRNFQKNGGSLGMYKKRNRTSLDSTPLTPPHQ